MIRRKICYLISETTKARGVFNTPETTEAKRFCQEMSVTRTEYYDADNVGLKPEVVLKLSRAGEYGNELTVRYQGKVYDIIRIYPTNDGGIELVCQRSDINA
jgi:SPP1 family predicted phage head-tail adaptor